jgi:hypothetical protein
MAWNFLSERQARNAPPAESLAIRQDQSRGHWDGLPDWLRTEGALLPDGSGIAGAIDFRLNRWIPLGRFLEDSDPSKPIDATASRRPTRNSETHGASGRKMQFETNEPG